MCGVVYGPDGHAFVPPSRAVSRLQPGNWACWQSRWLRVAHVHQDGDLVRLTFGPAEDPHFTTGAINGALTVRYSKVRPEGRPQQ